MALLAMLFIIFSANAEEDNFDIKVYPCKHSTSAIKVDGSLDEPAWQAAFQTGGDFTFYNKLDKPEPVSVQTTFRVLYDERYLYVGVTCAEPLMGKLERAVYAHDNAGIFRADVLECFVDDHGDPVNYFQFAVNPAGSLFDGRNGNATWDSGAIAATKADSDKWFLETSTGNA